MDKLSLLLKSRKFWAALVGLILIIVRAFIPDFSVSEDQLVSLVAVIAAYILGTAIEDAGSRPAAP